MRLALPLLVLSSLATAQLPVVSPIGHTNLEGPSDNMYPWSNPFRYQQVHTDLRGTPLPITGIAWRRNQDEFLPSTSSAKTFDMELTLCDADANTFGITFASNYVGTPVNVLVRRQVNSVDWRPAIGQRPAPFDFVIPFDVPFVYLGQNDLLYEVVVYMTSNSVYQCDAVNGLSRPTTIYGSYTSEGTGCTTTNGSFLLRSQLRHVFTTSQMVFQWDVVAAPPLATGAVLVGFAPFNVPVPGLCTNVYTDGSLLSVPLTSLANGTGSTLAIGVPYNPTWVGVPLSAQAACLDATQPGIGLAASQGVRSSIPIEVLPTVNGARVWSLNNPLSATGTRSPNSWLVTQFR